MKHVKKIIAILLAVSVLLILPVTAYAAKGKTAVKVDEKTDSAADVLEGIKEKAETNTVFDLEKAKSIALTAAKSRYAIEKIDSETAKTAVLTKIRYDKKSDSWKAVVRADNVHKFMCDISVKNLLGVQIGLPENQQYVRQNAFSAFFGAAGEKISYFFIHLFKGDVNKNTAE